MFFIKYPAPGAGKKPAETEHRRRRTRSFCAGKPAEEPRQLFGGPFFYFDSGGACRSKSSRTKLFPLGRPYLSVCSRVQPISPIFSIRVRASI